MKARKIGKHLRKGLKLVIAKQYTFMVRNSFFIVLNIPSNYLENTTHTNSTLPPGIYKASLDTSPPQKSSLHSKQMNRVIRRINGHPSSLLACM